MEITMQRVKDLNWPLQLFAEPYLSSANSNSTAPLLAKGKTRTDQYLCDCACKRKHHMSVSGLEGDHGFRVIRWFSTIECKNKYFGIGR